MIVILFGEALMSQKVNYIILAHDTPHLTFGRKNLEKYCALYTDNYGNKIMNNIRQYFTQLSQCQLLIDFYQQSCDCFVKQGIVQVRGC